MVVPVPSVRQAPGNEGIELSVHGVAGVFTINTGAYPSQGACRRATGTLIMMSVLPEMDEREKDMKDVANRLTLQVLVTTTDALGQFKQDNYSTVGGDGGCRVSEVRAGTTSPMPDHKGFKL